MTGDIDWIDLTRDKDKLQALVNMITSLWVPHHARNFLKSGGTLSFSKRTLLYGVS
jgi:hypothetical protein